MPNWRQERIKGFAVEGMVEPDLKFHGFTMRNAISGVGLILYHFVERGPK